MSPRLLALAAMAIFLSGTLGLCAAETVSPFDMSPERGNAPALSPAPAPVDQPPPSAEPPPAPESKPPEQQAAPVSQPAPDAAAPAPRSEKPEIGVFVRPILPYRQLVLEGEVDSRAWNIILTKDQAASPVTLTLGYQASVVVAPEASRLSLFVNGKAVFDTPISASDQIGKLSVDLPAGLLQTGANRFHLQAIQRHRTDCTISSTYELRTVIDSAATALHFRSPTASRLVNIQDLAATSPDNSGTAHLRIVAPALAQKVLAGPILRFAQSASILIGLPTQAIYVADTPGGSVQSGTVTAVIGTADDVRRIIHGLPADAGSRPIVTFVDDAELGPSTLVISGPTNTAVSQAVDAVASLVDRPQGVPRDVLDTSRWFAPNPPLLIGATRLTLASLGVETQEFAGRRFKTEFQLGIPSDFYSNSSGEATLLLDAAYSGEVLPGSHLDLYINGDIAATTPISTSGGEILRHLPIRIPMTNLRPGPNRITFEAQLHTASDAECAAGPTKGNNRFALFDTSEFVMPSFARIAQLPNLAALQGTAFPYNRPGEPAALVLSNYGADVMSAAATLLGHMAVVAGRVIPLDLNSSATNLGARNAIFVAPAAEIPASVPAQLDLDENIRTTWRARDDDTTPSQGVAGNALVPLEPAVPAVAPNDPTDTQETFDRWRDTLSSEGGGWRGNVSSFEDWVQRTFQLSSRSLRFLPSRGGPYHPSSDSTVMLAQGPSVSGDKAWTLLTAPNSALLREGANTLTASSQWSWVTGRVASYNVRAAEIQTQSVTTFAFIPTQPASFYNLRLITANWLSDNILAFSLLLFAACLLLGLATALFLSRIGRSASE